MLLRSVMLTQRYTNAPTPIARLPSVIDLMALRRKMTRPASDRDAAPR